MLNQKCLVLKTRNFLTTRSHRIIKMNFHTSVLILVLVCLISKVHAFSLCRNAYMGVANKGVRNSCVLMGGRSLRDTSEKISRYPDGRERVIRPRAASTRDKSIAHGKVSRILKDELVDIITKADIKARNYPDLALLRGVSIPRIEFTSDVSIATVYFSIAGNSVEKRQVYVWLCNNMGQVRYSLSQRLRSLRRLPTMKFSLIDTQAQFYLSDTLDNISAEMKNIPVDDDIELEFEEDGL